VVFDFGDFLNCLVSGARYIPTTLYAVAITMFLGVVFGGIIAILRAYKVPVINRFFSALFSVMTGIPPVLTIIIVHLVYVSNFASVTAFFRLNISIKDVDIVYIGIVALFLFSLPIISESILGAFMSVEKSQYDAGYSVGLTKLQVLNRIVIPQVIPVVTPMLINNVIMLTKASALLFLIGVTDIMNGSLIPSHTTYGYFEGYVAAGLIYWAVCIVLERVGAILEKRPGLKKIAT
jgi:L-cystine transport system permease protein